MAGKEANGEGRAINEEELYAMLLECCCQSLPRHLFARSQLGTDFSRIPSMFYLSFKLKF